MPASKFDKQQDIEIAALYKTRLTAQKIADMYGVYKQSVLNSLKRTNTERRSSFDREYSCGKNHKWYKDGMRHQAGYLQVHRPEHRLARGDGWIFVHRLVMDEKMGGTLKSTDIVHHKDGDKSNNDIDNLEVYPSNGNHLSKHSKEWNRDKKGRFVFTKT